MNQDCQPLNREGTSTSRIGIVEVFRESDEEDELIVIDHHLSSSSHSSVVVMEPAMLKEIKSLKQIVADNHKNQDYSRAELSSSLSSKSTSDENRSQNSKERDHSQSIKNLPKQTNRTIHRKLHTSLSVNTTNSVLHPSTASIDAVSTSKVSSSFESPRSDDNAVDSTNEDDQILMQVFDVFDTNGDGVISIAELQDVLLRLGNRVHDRELAFMISELTQNQTSHLTPNDFRELMRTPVSRLKRNRVHVDQQLQEEDPSSMIDGRRNSYPLQQGKRIENNRRHSIIGALYLRRHSRSIRFNRGFSKANLSKWPLIRLVRRMFGKSTCSADGNEQQAELEIEPQSPQPAIDPSSRSSSSLVDQSNQSVVQSAKDKRKEYLLTVFKVFDGNGDGVISIHEVQNIVQKLGLQQILSKVELQELFDSVDSDYDGCITFPEFHKLVE